MKGDFYHILNRGVDKRKLFLTEEDYVRFVDNARDFNNKNLTLFSYKNRRKYYSEMTSPNEMLVDVICWCLMPNHFHYMAREKIEKGAGVFARKLTCGYTMYFNPRHKRSGTLFQGRSKIIPIRRDAHFFHIPFYILSNPLDLFQPSWREKGVKNPKAALEFLKNYQWSAFSDLITKEGFSETMNKVLFYELFDTNEKQFKKDFLEWLVSSEVSSPN